MIQGDRYRLFQGDVMDVLSTFADESRVACICDPPYGLGQTPDMIELLTHWLADKHYDTKKGFMNAAWDVVPGPNVWREIYRILRPGGILMAFGGTRTADLLSIAIRLAGFERFDEISYHHTILPGRIDWVQGSGFPKNCDISKAIDREAGAEREVIGRKPGLHSRGNIDLPDGWHRPWMDDPEKRNLAEMETAPATDAARTWAGYGTSLKPSHEPILLFRKPRTGTYAQTAITHGTGAINVDGCRVPTSQSDAKAMERCNTPGSGRFYGSAFAGDIYGQPGTAEGKPLDTTQGRWPANVIFDQAAADLLDKMSGESKLFTGVTLVDDNDTSWYNNDQEVLLCNEIASIAEILLTHVRQMLNGDLVDFAAVSADMLINRSLEAIGNTSEKMRADGMSNGVSQAAERFTQDAGPYGFGNKQTAHFQMGLKSIISTTTKLMIASKTSKLSLTTNTKNYTERLGQITKSLTVLSSEGVNDAPSIGRFQNSISELLELTADIASRVAVTAFPNGERKTGNTTGRMQENTTNGAGPSRFFQVLPTFIYQAKAATSERNEGLDELPLRAAGALKSGDGGWRDEEARGRQPRHDKQLMARNTHPCVKPVTLTEYLARLIVPPKEYREDARLLVPFAGSGSEMIGALLAGWLNVDGIELDEGYIEIARQRLEHWRDELSTEPRQINGRTTDYDAMPLFAELAV